MSSILKLLLTMNAKLVLNPEFMLQSAKKLSKAQQ
jgi:hypothetical protein